MEKLRLNPVTQRWIIITGEDISYGKISSQQARIEPADCPFCPGNESMTPPEIEADRPSPAKPDSPGWLTRTVPNKFPALKDYPRQKRSREGIFEKMPGIGSHEVIIESPAHNKQLADLSREEIERVIKAYRRRSISLSKDKRFKYILIFKNHGLAAGASLEHPHTQLICLPVIPKRVSEELACTGGYFQEQKRCMFCDIIAKEKKEKVRLVLENEDFTAFCPFFARSPFELTIIPKEHSSDFRRINRSQVESLAGILKDTLARLRKVLGDFPYNFLIHTRPINSRGSSFDFYHWHIELLPKLGEISGFEWATGGYLNPLMPEKAAALLCRRSTIERLRRTSA